MKNRIVLFSLLLLALMLITIIVRIITNAPPALEINQARLQLSEAELVKSQKYAYVQYVQAKEYYELAMGEWRLQNERSIIFRNFRKVVELANQSAESSREAMELAIKNMSEVQDLLEVRIHALGERMTGFEKQMGNFPMELADRKSIVKSKMLFDEAVLAFKKKDYSSCKSKLDSVETTTLSVFPVYEAQYVSYFEGIIKWNEMLDHTILASKKYMSYVIVVDKLARELKIYKDGRLINKYTVDLGVNWVGDKMQEGDKSTPEGMYKVVAKKSKGQTRFYKALLLDYPNDEDRKRFLQNKKNGVVMPHANIGGLIEIHGKGGKGVDWTDGCVALEDADMDKVFDLCRVGTKVTIVGSTMTQEEHSKYKNEN